MNGQFPPRAAAIPTIGQQRKATEAAVGQAIRQLSLQIYSRLAEGVVGTKPRDAELDCDRMRQLARDSHTASKCFFEGLGVIQFDEGAASNG